MRDKTIEVLAASKAELPASDVAIVACTYRNTAGQFAVWQCGRDESGNIVDKAAVKTYKKPGTSEHNHVDSAGRPASRAVDLLILRHGRVVDDGADPSYAILGAIGKRFGLEWSGDWRCDLESAHFQLLNAGTIRAQ